MKPSKRFMATAFLSVHAVPVLADFDAATLRGLSAPDSIDTRVGKLEFEDEVPAGGTAQAVFDKLDFTRALSVYNNSFRGTAALGFH